MASVEHCMYCFDVLVAHIERRQPMTLYQVIQSWQEYPKGLDNDDDDEDPPADPSADSQPTKPSRPPLSSPAISRLSAASSTSRGNTPSPSASSSSLLSPTSNNTTPSDGAETPAEFTPIGVGRKTSQRATVITESPLFVTWNKASGTGSYNLRGCIGTFEAQPLSSGLASYALTSALHDTRFAPVSARELSRLEVAVTLLTDFETCADAMDWTLGVHGLRISFYYRNRRYGATYLPDVAVEQGWSKEETLVSLMRKAGWLGREEKWRDVGDLRVVRYQGKKESVEWEEYRAWKDWVDKGGKK